MASAQAAFPEEDIEGGDRKYPYADGESKHAPVTADEAIEIAIGETNVEYTVESENSPYLEVRANVPNTDDPTIPVNTVRMWFLGVVFTLVCNPEGILAASTTTANIGTGRNWN